MDTELVSLLVAAIASVVGTSGAAWLARLTSRSVEPTQGEIIQAEKDAEDAWDAVPVPVPPTSAGRAEALQVLAAYATDLNAEAARIAKRVGADVPGATHVRLASDRVGILRNRAGALADVLLGLGAILLGAAGSYWINLATGGRGIDGSQTYAVIALGLGVALFTWAATTKLKHN